MDECDNLVLKLEKYGVSLADILNASTSESEPINDNDNDNDEEIARITENSEFEDFDTESESFSAMGQAESKKSLKAGERHVGGGGVAALQTKGTSISFGFRKKLNSTPKKLKKLIIDGANLESATKHKKQDKCNNVTMAGVYGGAGRDANEPSDCKDNNGNAGGVPPVHFAKMGAGQRALASPTSESSEQWSATSPDGGSSNDQQQQQQQRVGPNRFGYRGAAESRIPRPASTGIPTALLRGRSAEAANTVNNNNNGNGNALSGSSAVATNSNGDGNQNKPFVLVSNLKRRSKSAHAGRVSGNADEDDGVGAGEQSTPKITQPKTLTFNLNQNKTIEYQRRQFFEQPSPAAAAAAEYGVGRRGFGNYNTPPVKSFGVHSTVAMRPAAGAGMATATAATRAQPAPFAKFTLQTVSLPRPEFPVAISLSANTPTTPCSVVQSPLTAGGFMGARAKEPSAQPVAVAPRLRQLDQKTVKQLANSSRRGFSGCREISADSGISGMDTNMDHSASSGSSSASGSRYLTRRNASPPKRSRSRPRNLQMVMNGRGTFEVRDIDDPPSSGSNSFVEPLALPKLPVDNNQALPLPLNGLVRSNTVLSRETYEQRNKAKQETLARQQPDERDGVTEEKLLLDSTTTEKSAKLRYRREVLSSSSRSCSPANSTTSSWLNAGESMAAKECSSVSISSSESSHKAAKGQYGETPEKDIDMSVDLEDVDISLVNTDMQMSTLSSISEQDNKFHDLDSNTYEVERPRLLINESKFAELALASSDILLDDETSPTDSLVSSTCSEEAAAKLKKHKINAELQEKDIDEISPELEFGSPGTPTHASHSLSLSDCGNLIDDEIADQPALLFNDTQDSNEQSLTSHKDKTDTPTLMETLTESLRSLNRSKSKTRTALQQAIELSLRTPVSLRKAVLERAESLDTLSPCESICSDDLMMDFDLNSSMDSIDRATSAKSRSGTDLTNPISDTELFSQLDSKGSEVMKELNTLLRTRMDREKERKSVMANLPARAARLLQRSRVQQPEDCTALPNGCDSDNGSVRSAHGSYRSSSSAAALRHSAASSTAASVHASPFSTAQRRPAKYGSGELHSSSDDLMLYDKSFRNAMIQDVLQFKKQLIRLRRILQETETLNPFENDNSQLFAECGLDSKQLNDIDLASLTSSTSEDPLQELADLRRQVVYLQSQVDDRDRTIRYQRDLIEKLEAQKPTPGDTVARECISSATQTERTRSLANGGGIEGLSRIQYGSQQVQFLDVVFGIIVLCAVNIICVLHLMYGSSEDCYSD